MTSFRTAPVQGLNIFYREAGDPANPRHILTVLKTGYRLSRE